LRIAAKKLRYAAEFCADVFPRKTVARRGKQFLAGLEALQACLGDLNDIAVNKRLSASLVPAPASGEALDDQVWEAFIAGRLCGHEEGRFSSVMKGAMRAHRVFAGAKRFWI
jgi:CHAD domain-containing protein